jgi:hypothetical protein
MFTPGFTVIYYRATNGGYTSAAAAKISIYVVPSSPADALSATGVPDPLLATFDRSPMAAAFPGVPAAWLANAPDKCVAWRRGAAGPA